MTPDSLATALRTCAAGLYPLEAGVGLLIANGTFLHRDDFTSRFILHSTSTGEDAQMAAVDWDAATAALAAGELPCSSGFSEQCKASWRVGMSQRSRALQGCPGPAAADVEDRQRGEEADRFSLVCPVSVPIRLAARPKHPGDSGILDISAIGRRNGHPA